MSLKRNKLFFIIVIIVCFIIIIGINYKKQTNNVNVVDNSSNTANTNNTTEKTEKKSETKALASELLKTNPSAEDDAIISPFVMYNSIPCRVLYDSDSEFGLQIIALDTVENVQIGGNTFEETQNSYNNAMDLLNSTAKKYMDNKGIATNARCIGSNPINQEDTNEMYVDNLNSLKKYGWNGKLKVADENYNYDCNQIERLYLKTLWKTYWLASRYIYGEDFSTTFKIRIRASGVTNEKEICSVFSDNTGAYFHIEQYGVRPIFVLSSNALIISGDGTEDNPYVLGI